MNVAMILAMLLIGEAPNTKGELGPVEVTQLGNSPAIALQVGRKAMLLFGLTFESKEEAEAVKKWLNDNFRRKQPAKVLSYKIVSEGNRPSSYIVTPRGGSAVPIDHWMSTPSTMARGILYDPEGHSLNAELIRKGMARTKEKRFEADLEAAQDSKSGVWAKRK